MQISNEKYYRIIQSVLSKYEYSALPEEVRKGFEKEIRIRLSWNTNSLEGNTLTLEETVDALEYDEVRSGHTYSEYTEAKTAYLANCELSFTARKETDLELLHRINGIIMGTDGSFRTRQVYVGSIAEVAWMPAKPDEISGKMEQWLQKAVDAVVSGPEYPKVYDVLKAGWVGEEALAIAVWAAMKYPNDLKEAIVKAVNHSGDSDSTGAICGYIIGASLGEEAIPASWLEHLELKDMIVSQADTLCTMTQYAVSYTRNALLTIDPTHHKDSSART